MKQLWYMVSVIGLSSLSGVSYSVCNVPCEFNHVQTLKRVDELERYVMQFINVVRKTLDSKNKKLPAGQRVINVANKLFKEFSCSAHSTQLSVFNTTFDSTSDMLQALTILAQELQAASGDHAELWKHQVFDRLVNNIQMLHATVYEKRKVLKFVDNAKNNNKQYISYINQKLNQIERILQKTAIRAEEISAVLALSDDSNTMITKLLSRQASENAYGNFEQEYVSNFSGTEIEPEKAYEFIGIDKEVARTLSAEEINRRIAQKLNEEVEKTERTQAELTAGKSVWRQLGYLFRTDLTKGNYDAFLFGPEVVQAIALTSEESDELQKLFEKYLGLALDIAEIQSKESA